MIGIIDYGVGNIYSLSSSLKHLGVETIITRDEKELEKVDRIILPGVGAFEDAILKLKETGLVETIKSQAKGGKPLLGICLGMQLLVDESNEYGKHEGLCLIEGTIESIEDDLVAKNGNKYNLKVPHIGWNRLEIEKNNIGNKIFKYFDKNSYVYYVHSYYACDCKKNTLAYSEYDLCIPGVVAKNNIYGMQFHPEKIGDAGLALLKGFSRL